MPSETSPQAPEMQAIEPVASFQMYRRSTDSSTIAEWWTGLRRHMRANGIDDAPETLAAPEDIHRPWHSPHLVFSQTCGAPLIRELGQTVRVIGTPAYDTPDTDRHLYRSAIIVRRSDPARTLGDLAGRRLAINGRESFSGCLALRSMLAGLVDSDRHFFGSVVISGRHTASLRMVACGEADCAAIDVVSCAYIRRDEPETVAAIRVMARTPLVPGLPFITQGTASDDRLEALRRAVEDMFADPKLASIRTRLLLKGFKRTTAEDYEPVARAIANGADVVL